MKVRLSQVNPTVGAFRENLQMIRQEISLAVQEECDVVILPELVTVGYPPRDLLYHEEFWDEHDKMLHLIFRHVTSFSQQITVIFGGLHRVRHEVGFSKYNTAWIFDKTFGKRYVHKELLPYYDVFDESRYFSSRVSVEFSERKPIAILEGTKSILCDVLICEDIWNNRFMADLSDGHLLSHSYGIDPVGSLDPSNAGPLFVINSSPFWRGKIEETTTLLSNIAIRLNRPVYWVNQVGAHDDIITGGYSTVVDNNGLIVAQAKAFETDALVLKSLKPSRVISEFPVMIFGREVDQDDFDMWCLYKALYLYLSDYMRRTGFTEAVLGLSGGIDSAAVAAIASDVLGPFNVTGYTLPSRFSSEGSIDDSRTLAKNADINFRKVSIQGLHTAAREACLSGGKQEFTHPVTDENLQPRVRALLLMAFSNDTGAILLTTGNKSEISVGYCTLYGDTCGGIAVLSDTWKTDVFRLCKFINKYKGYPGGFIPNSIIDKPPSAELRENQKDTDSLPEYEVLDGILKMLVGGRRPLVEIYSKFGVGVVDRISRLYRMSEYKRQQMPVGPKHSKVSFGPGRRMPIAAKFERF